MIDDDPQTYRRWCETWKADPVARALAERHYNRHSPGASLFMPPGRSLVLRTLEGDAVWGVVLQKHSRHAWPGAWMNCIFRNESPHLSSSLIEEAVAMTRGFFGEPPAHGLITFVDSKKTHRKRDPGRCYVKAGFKRVGVTKDAGLIVLQMLPEDMPRPMEPRSSLRKVIA